MTNSNSDDSKMITCQELEAFIDDYIDDKLSPPQLAVFTSHLDMCPACDSYLDNYRNAVSLGKSAYEDESNCQDIPEPLVQAILSASKKLS